MLSETMAKPALGLAVREGWFNGSVVSQGWVPSSHSYVCGVKDVVWVTAVVSVRLLFNLN